MMGVFYVTYHDGTIYHDYYREALVQYPFDTYYPDHASWDYDSDALYGVPAVYLDYIFIGYGGDIDYDNAWDWDAITDPDIRDAVYERYTPYNLP